MRVSQAKLKLRKTLEVPGEGEIQTMIYASHRENSDHDLSSGNLGGDDQQALIKMSLKAPSLERCWRVSSSLAWRAGGCLSCI